MVDVAAPLPHGPSLPLLVRTGEPVFGAALQRSEEPLYMTACRGGEECLLCLGPVLIKEQGSCCFVVCFKERVCFWFLQGLEESECKQGCPSPGEHM